MKRSSRLSRYRILLHLAGWSVYSTIMIWHNTTKYVSSTPLKVLMVLPLCAMLFYVVLSTFRWIDRDRTRIWKGMKFLGSFYLTGAILGYAYSYGLTPALGVPIQRADVPYTHGAYVGQLYLFYLRYTGYAALVFLMEKCIDFARSTARHREQINTLQVRLQHADYEGDASDSRLAMHFLGNALQRCYVILHGVQQHAAGAIQRIDKLLSYALDVYSRKSVSLVPLAKEVNQLKEMMALDRVNAPGGPYIDLYLPVNLRGYKVPALTFITFYENILKHGITGDSERPAVIRLEVKNGGYQMTVENHVSGPRRVSGRRGSIGLTTVKSRLAEKFGDKFDIAHKKGNDRFYLVLKVWG